MKILFQLIVLLSFGMLSAQSFVVTNATVFDGEAVTENISVLVQDAVITAIVKDIKREATVIDPKGKFLMPALTNSHVHAWGPNSLTEAAKAGVTNLLDMHGVEMVQGMMKPATSLLAKYFPFGKTGSIQVGYKADLLLLNSNPIKDITNISTVSIVWKDGKMVK